MKCLLRIDRVGKPYVSDTDSKVLLINPHQVYRVWQSTQDLLDYANWLPEVVGTVEELRRIGSVPVLVLQPEQEQPELFKNSDVSKYRRLLTKFRLKYKGAN